jgi:hypothetical protein
MYEFTAIAGVIVALAGVYLLLRYITRPEPIPARPGSARWLIDTERKYGGHVIGIVRRTVSPHDPRPKEELKNGGMVGGDRMAPSAHGYSVHYARHLHKFSGPVVVVEVGILRGTGLAIWSDLFQEGQVIGLDIDLSHFKDSKSKLIKSGAFSTNNVEVHEFDQFTCTPETFDKILNGRKVDIYIDDGFHTDETILNTFKAIRPHLQRRCVCFIEDNQTVATTLLRLDGSFNVESRGLLTILSRYAALSI